MRHTFCTLIKNNENLFKSHCPENLWGWGMGRVSGNSVISASISVLSALRGWGGEVILSRYSLMIKITHSPGKTGRWNVFEPVSTLSKWDGLQRLFHMCSIYFDNNRKSQPQSIVALFFPLIFEYPLQKEYISLSYTKCTLTNVLITGREAIKQIKVIPWVL